MNSETQSNDPEAKDTIYRIIELARWAPSGDNTQPWRFDIIDEMSFNIHTSDTRDWCVYDLDGNASKIAVGALLETIEIAANNEKMRVDFCYQGSVIKATLSSDHGIEKNNLVGSIKTRCTQRRPFEKTALTPTQKEALEQSVGDSYRILWFEGKALKWSIAKLLFKNAEVRLTIREAYEVHKQIIEWDARFSETKIPDQAVGLDVVSLKLMRWAMTSWSRVQWLNKYLSGTLMPRVQLDLMPARNCAAHFIIVAKDGLESEQAYYRGGAAMQRFWLTSAGLGLQFQPEMTPIIFSNYINKGVKFTDNSNAILLAKELSEQLTALTGTDAIENRVFMGRVGVGKSPWARSIRLSVANLLKR